MATDLAAFEARYGFTVQEYVNLCAVGMLLAPHLSAANQEVVAAEAALKALGNQDAIGATGDHAKIQELANAINRVTAAKEIVHDWAPRQEYAKQFAAGTLSWAAFRSYFGAFPQELIDEGLVNEAGVRAALRGLEP